MSNHKKVYQWATNSNAAPFFSDTDIGFIKATDPMSALEEVVNNYDHPCGLYAAAILEPSPKNPVLARYISARAATIESAPNGEHVWRQGGLYVNGKKVRERKERYELVKK
ncbi:hypothetical protein JXB28_02260 [Candidatus Woesearchaeota archaeon]|nr:hypothetical protein [Candidatus Woesearchaeota archaeon]